MKIAYICSDVGIPVFGTKGASVHLRAVVAALERLGHSVRVFSPAVDTPSMPRQPAGFQAVNFTGITEAVSQALAEDVPEPGHLAAEWSRVYYNEYLQRTITPDLERLQPDIIYERYSLFGYAGAELAERLGVPLLLEVNAPLTLEQEKYRRLVLKSTADAIERRLFQRADALFAVSEELKEFAVSRGARPDRVHVQPNAVNPALFNPSLSGSPVRERHGLTGKKVVAFVGSLKLWHDIDTLLDAARRLYEQDQDFRLLVVGDGPRLPDLQAMDAPFLVCTGGVEHEEVPVYLAASDVIAVPYSQHEDQYFSPLKLFEAMAMAKPVVGARLGQVQDVIEDGTTGRLYTPDDAADLAAKLHEVLASPDRGAAMGRAALGCALDNYTWEANARRIETVAQKLTSQLLRDGRLPDINLVWAPLRLTEVLNAEVMPDLLAGARLSGVELVDLTYRPARQCISTFDLLFEPGIVPQKRRAIVSFVKDERFKAVYEKNYAAYPGRAVYLPDRRCLVELFPADWELPGLRKAYEPDSAAALMRDAGLPLPDGVELAGEVLTYRAHEAAVIAYRDAAGGPFRAVSKTTSESRKAEYVHNIAQMLRRQLDGETVSTPQTYRPKGDRYVTFMDMAPGVSFHAALVDATQRNRMIELTARALAQLHDVKIEERMKERKSLPQGLDHTRERAGRLSLAVPDLGRRAESILDAIAPLVRDEFFETTFLHGDFKGTQVLIDGDRLAVIDLDSSCLGDPAVDVGNMMSDLNREAAFTDNDYSRGVATRFLEAYVDATGRKEVAAKARVFQGIALVRMAVHGFRQHPNSFAETDSQTAVLLREAEACLGAL